MQGRLQAARLYHMTDDKGVRDLLSFLIARDTMHQNQWLAAIAELQAEGLEQLDRKSTRLNSSHANISYAVFCLKKKKNTTYNYRASTNTDPLASINTKRIASNMRRNCYTQHE